MKVKLIVLAILMGSLGSGGCEMLGEDESRDDSPVVSSERWIPLESGYFEMGDDVNVGNASPVHEVHVSAFKMKRTEVTVSEYGECVDAGVCTVPVGAQGTCNWENRSAWGDHPVNCIQWDQAVTFCNWYDGGSRLPSEAEWEYAARSAGKIITQTYPWGKASPSCLYAIMTDEFGIDGCGTRRTWPVCSKPEGNTGQGICDMAGNVSEWVQDHSHVDYNGNPPLDGSAWEEVGGTYRVLRGAAYNGNQSHFFAVAFRGNSDPSMIQDSIGFRCAK